MEDKTIITLVALIMLCVIEVCAISNGIDGTLLSVVIGIFGAVVGVPIGYKLKEKTG